MIRNGLLMLLWLGLTAALITAILAASWWTIQGADLDEQVRHTPTRATWQAPTPEAEAS